MQSTSYRTAEGALAIRQSGGIAAKLFGLPFAAAGGWFLYYLVIAIVAMFHYPTFRDVLGGIPGLLLLIVMALIFGGPGVLLIFGSLTVTVDPATHDLIARRNLVFFRKEERNARSEIAAVSVASKRLAGPNSTSWAWHIEAELKRKSKKFVLIGLSDEVENARAIATEFAAAIGVPLVVRGEEEDLEDADLVEES